MKLLLRHFLSKPLTIRYRAFKEYHANDSFVRINPTINRMMTGHTVFFHFMLPIQIISRLTRKRKFGQRAKAFTYFLQYHMQTNTTIKYHWQDILILTSCNWDCQSFSRKYCMVLSEKRILWLLFLFGITQAKLTRETLASA